MIIYENPNIGTTFINKCPERKGMEKCYMENILKSLLKPLKDLKDKREQLQRALDLETFLLIIKGVSEEIAPFDLGVHYAYTDIVKEMYIKDTVDPNFGKEDKKNMQSVVDYYLKCGARIFQHACEKQTDSQKDINKFVVKDSEAGFYRQGIVLEQKTKANLDFIVSEIATINSRLRESFTRHGFVVFLIILYI